MYRTPTDVQEHGFFPWTLWGSWELTEGTDRVRWH